MAVESHGVEPGELIMTTTNQDRMESGVATKLLGPGGKSPP
jgi:hypothetical protein